RTVAFESPPRSNDAFVAAKKIEYVIITPIAERAAMSSHRRRVGGPDQQTTSVATVAAPPPAPRGIISRPMRWEYDANQAWKSVGERLFQKLTNATPITSMPPASKPRTRPVTIIRVDATSARPRESVMASDQAPRRRP